MPPELSSEEVVEVYAIDQTALWRYLCPVLGTRLLVDSGVTDTISMKLNTFSSNRKALHQLATEINDLLFSVLYHVHMQPILDNGLQIRIKESSLEEISDDCMYFLFSAMAISPADYLLLREYAINAGSRSAQRILYESYGQYMSGDERSMLKKILISRYPSLPPWLAEQRGLF